MAQLEEQVAGGDRQAGQLDGRAASRELADVRLASQRLRSRCGRRAEPPSSATSAGLDTELAAAADAEHRPPRPLARHSRHTGNRNDDRCSKPGVQPTWPACAELEQARNAASRETGTHAVDVARSEQQARSSCARQRGQLDRDQQERAGRLTDNRAHLALAAARARDADRNILAAESAVAELFLRKEVLRRGNVEKINRREAGSAAQGRAGPGGAATAQPGPQAGNQLARQGTGGQRSAARARTTVADRLREDYGIELAALDERVRPRSWRERQRSRPKSPICAASSTASAA